MELMLSPRTHFKLKKKTRECEFGCCSECRKIVNQLGSDPSHEAKCIIANGLCVRDPPECPLKLNDVEMAMMCLARISKQIFSCTGGSHQSTRGWHTMCKNDIEVVNGTVNCMNEHNEENDSESEEEDSDEEDEDEGAERRFLPKVAVVLTGPFTPHQVAKAKEAMKVNWGRTKEATKWLKRNNRLCKDHELCDRKIIEPIAIDHSREVESKNLNVETSCETHCVFPDSEEPNDNAGGFNGAEGHKQNALDDLVNKTNGATVKLLSRPQKEMLRDHESDNLLKAFILQFPCGHGIDDNRDQDKMGKVPHCKHLMLHSRKEFHKGDFACVMHDTHNRCKMVNRACVKVNNSDAREMAQTTPGKIESAVDRMLNNAKGTTVADQFLNAVKTSAGAMPHSSLAAMNAKSRMHAMMTSFGMPTLMHTVTPEDGHNFRARIHTGKRENCREQEMPCHTAEEKTTCDFRVQCQTDRCDHPGLCAFDFEQVCEIIMEHLIGWNMSKHMNEELHGIFGEIIAWCFANEEQGRKTSHRHSLTWACDWNKLVDGIHGVDAKHWEAQLTEHLDLALDATLCGPEDMLTCNACNGNLKKCTWQDLRNLRCACGTSSQGGKCTLKCMSCDKGCDSETLAIVRLEKLNVLNGGREDTMTCPLNTFKQDGVGRMRLEISLMNCQMGKHGCAHWTKGQAVSEEGLKCVITALRNVQIKPL